MDCHDPGNDARSNDEQFETGDFYIGSPELADEDWSDSETRSEDDQYPSLQSITATVSSLDGADDDTDPDPDIPDSDYVALGCIRLYRSTTDSTLFYGGSQAESTRAEWPPPFVQSLISKSLLKLQTLSHVSDSRYFIARVFIVPEDVRRNPTPSFMSDRRRCIRRLLSITDASPEVWSADYGHTRPMTFYHNPPSTSESLFHIFNTLQSPKSSDEPQHKQDGTASLLKYALKNIKTPLYPYQKRSMLAMLQREMLPKKSVDPRKPLHYDLTGQSFHLDVHDGIVLKQPQYYEESRGGVLAETMGYGKTVIALALICATRGQFPGIPEGRLDVKRGERPKVVSLLEMAATAAGKTGVAWKAEFHTLAQAGYNHDRCVDELKKHHREYVEPIYHPTNPGRNGKRLAEKIVRVCCATLVIVPQNLLVQWQQEIARHVKHDALDILIIDNSKKPIPPATELANRDLVLITKTRLEQEYRDDDLHNGKRKKGEAIFQSPLIEMRWLRVICDEGHAFAGSATRTNALAMLDKMYIERRWVVSGTPSNALVGVEVGIAADISEAPRNDKIMQSLQSKRLFAAEEEAKDVDKLRQLVSGFLKMPPWANRKGVDHASWKKYLSPFDSKGQRRKTACLRTLLQSLVVRHRIQDIDTDLELPPLYNRTIYLEPSFFDKLSLNLFTMVLTANAVTSERTDEDYLFHSSNRKDLDVLIRNLRQSSFHWVGFKPEHITETLKNCNKYLDSHLDSISDNDGELIMEAVMNGDRAVNDDGWLAFSKFHEIGVYVGDFPKSSAGAWALHGRASDPLLLGSSLTRRMQHWVEDNLENATSGLTRAGWREMHAARLRVEEAADNKKANAGKSTEEPTLKGQTSSEANESIKGKKRRRPSSSVSLSSEWPLMKATIVGFSSAKLTYLVDQVLKYQATEKIIIFYDVGNVAYWIGEAFDLLSIKYLIYANTLTVARRASYLATFNERDEFRVLLMDLGQAALGLHVACASRVYMVSPIWQPNIESQAIKRAHRIGQTKPVHVETLVLQGTLEDKILSRRREMSDGELKKAAKNLLDDRTMSQMIREQKFLKFTPGEEGEQYQFCRLAEPQALFGKVSQKFDDPEDEIVLVEGDVRAPQRKKQKTVQIAMPVRVVRVEI